MSGDREVVGIEYKAAVELFKRIVDHPSGEKYMCDPEQTYVAMQAVINIAEDVQAAVVVDCPWMLTGIVVEDNDNKPLVGRTKP